MVSRLCSVVELKHESQPALRSEESRNGRVALESDLCHLHGMFGEVWRRIRSRTSSTTSEYRPFVNPVDIEVNPPTETNRPQSKNIVLPDYTYAVGPVRSLRPDPEGASTDTEPLTIPPREVRLRRQLYPRPQDVLHEAVITQCRDSWGNFTTIRIHNNRPIGENHFYLDTNLSLQSTLSRSNGSEAGQPGNQSHGQAQPTRDSD